MMQYLEQVLNSWVQGDLAVISIDYSKYRTARHWSPEGTEYSNLGTKLIYRLGNIRQ